MIISSKKKIFFLLKRFTTVTRAGVDSSPHLRNAGAAVSLRHIVAELKPHFTNHLFSFFYLSVKVNNLKETYETQSGISNTALL